MLLLQQTNIASSSNCPQIQGHEAEDVSGALQGLWETTSNAMMRGAFSTRPGRDFSTL
jgi:hypothetical protein